MRKRQPSEENSASLQRKASKGVLEVFQHHQGKGHQRILWVWSNELRLLKESKLTYKPLRRTIFNTFVLLMSLSEISPFSVVTKERHCALLSGLSVTEGAGQEVQWEGLQKTGMLHLTLSPCHQGSAWQHSANRVSGHVLAAALFPGDKYLNPDNFAAICWLGQHHHSPLPGKAPPGCFRPKDNWNAIPKTYPKQAGFGKRKPFWGQLPQSALMIFWIMNQGRAAAAAEAGVSGNSQPGCQIKTNTIKSSSTFKGFVLLTWARWQSLIANACFGCT